MAANHDWQSLVELSGLLVSEPVLRENFPDGPQPLEAYLSRRFRTEYERWQGSENGQKRWLDFVLSEVLGYDENRLRSGLSLPPHVVIELTDYAQTLKPNTVLLDEQVQPLLLVYVAEGELDRPEQITGRWKASPFTKLDRLLRDTRVQLGLLTNGQDWRLVYAAPGLPTSYITWSAAGWSDERSTLQAFVMLLRDPHKLLAMASESQQRQADVTDQLGNQVLSALAIFVRELDSADREANKQLLAGMTPEQVYETALFLMMRLVFIFYAEENSLLPHGDVFYDQAYGLTYLWNRLDRERLIDEERFEQRHDAWPGLLATFRLIHEGCNHPDFSMVAYGGALFDPDRFSVLEDPRLKVDNATLWRILQQLTTAENRDGRQRVSYRSLQVEQLGYVYENLLGYTVREAKEPMIQPKGGVEAFPLVNFQNALNEGKLYDYFKSVTKLHWSQAKNIAQQVEEWAGEADQRFTPLTEAAIEPGDRYVAFQMGTRKRGGIFYTPPQLTSFLVEQALKPQCYDDHESDSPRIKAPQHILSLTVCDPAMGSGAFLVQAVRYLAERLLEAWDARVAETPNTTLVMPYAQPEREALENYGPIPTDRAEAIAWARRFVAERCIYGVDLNHLAVELAKLSLWLVTLSKDKPFTFLDHRLRHGNSLIGASFFAETELEIKKGKLTAKGRARQIEFIPDQALQPRKDASAEEKGLLRKRIEGNRTAQQAIIAGQMSLFADMSVEEALRGLVEQRDELGQPTRRAGDYASKESLLREVLEQGRYPQLKEIADLWCAVWFWPRAHNGSYNPPPATQEYQDAVYTILGKPVAIATGQSRLESIRDTAQQMAAQEHFFHWELEFPEIFTRDNPGFDAMVGNPPWNIVQEDEIGETALESFKEWFKQDRYELLGGRRDLYKAFTVLGMDCVRTLGSLALLTPIGMFIEDESFDLRKPLYKKKGSVSLLQHFQNHGQSFFKQVHASYRFTGFVFVRGVFGAHRFSTVTRTPAEISEVVWITVPHDVLESVLGESLGAVLYPDDHYYHTHSSLLETVSQRRKIGFDVMAEFHATSDNDLRSKKPNNGDWQTLKNKSIHQYDHFYAEGGWYLAQEVVEERCQRKELDVSVWTGTMPRLLFRDIARNDDTRTLISCLAPRGFVSTYDTPMVLINGGESVNKLSSFYMVSVMNSFVSDFIIRPYVDKHIKGYILRRLPVPAVPVSNHFFDSIVPRGARLTCFTYHFAELWEEVMGKPWPDDPLVCPPPRSGDPEIEALRQRLRDEIDALVAHLYGLNRDDFAHILGTFPLVFPDNEQGRAKKEALLRVYDEFAEITQGWSRE